MTASFRYDGTFVATSERRVGAALGIGILFLPIVFGWLVLRAGYSARARVIVFAWMAVMLFAMFMSNHEAGSTPSAASASVQDITVQSPEQAQAAEEAAAPAREQQRTAYLRANPDKATTMELWNIMAYGQADQPSQAQIDRRAAANQELENAKAYAWQAEWGDYPTTDDQVAAYQQRLAAAKARLAAAEVKVNGPDWQAKEQQTSDAFGCRAAVRNGMPPSDCRESR